MQGLQFLSASTRVRSDPARADIACFVGFVARRMETGADRLRRERARLERVLRGLGWDGPSLPSADRVLPLNVTPGGDSPRSFWRWLSGLGWRPGSSATAAMDLFRRTATGLLGEAVVEWWVDHGWLAPFSDRSAADLLELLDVPVPIDSWDTFDALFAWDERPLVADATRTAETMVGAAVRRFFLQGGRKCYVVRVGDPWPPFGSPDARMPLRARLFDSWPEPMPVDRSTWHGVAHLFGLPDVSFLCVPDLPDLFAVDARPIAPETDVEGPERFVESGTRTAPLTARTLRAFPAPRSDEDGFRQWSAFVGQIGSLLERRCREVQFVGALPLVADEALLRTRPDIADLEPAARPKELAARVSAARRAQHESAGCIQTAFVQLAYPWLRTREAGRLPGAVEPPDAMLTGVLANNALTVGTWRSADWQPVAGIVDLEPTLSIEERQQPLPYHDAVGERRLPRTVQERISIFGATATGFELLSDVTTDDDEAYRPANVNRLVASLVRAARLIGEDAVFETNGEALWRHLGSSLEEVLLGLWGEGALAGASAADAFEVRCDRSTMTQADIDGGRVIARVEFNAASPVERITVVFSMDEGGQVTLVEPRAAETTRAVS